MDEIRSIEQQLRTDMNALPDVRHLCDSMPGGFFVYYSGGDEKLIYVNRAMLRIFKCETEEEFRKLTNNSFKGIVHPDDYQRVSESIVEQIESSIYNLDYVEYRIIRSDGSVRWVQDYGRYVNTAAGGIFYVFIEDATDRMQQRIDELESINEELKETHAREFQYKSAILHNAVTFFEINVTQDGFIPAPVHAEGPETASIFDIMGCDEFKSFSEFVTFCTDRADKKARDEFQTFFNTDRLIKCYEDGVPEQIFEYTFPGASGKSHVFQYVLLLGKNEFSGDIIASVIVKDITEVSEKQRMFQAALSEANAENIASQTFLSRISGDMSAQISSIMSFAEMISYNTSHPDIQKYCLDRIKAAGASLLDLVNESIKLTDKSSKKMVLGVNKCDLSDLLSDVKRRLISDAAHKRIRLTIDESGVKHTKVMTDPVRVEEILWQLLENAVNFTDDDGTITITARETDNLSENSADYTFEITDNGVGIEDAVLENIFDPFARSGKNGEKTGMGLAVVKNFVDLMNGSITIDSKVGEGTRVTVKLKLTLCG